MSAPTPARGVDLSSVLSGPASTRVYLRHCYLPAAGPPDPLWVNASMPSRWQTAGGTLYVAEDPDTVWAEHCRNSSDDVAGADPTGGFGLNERNFAAYASRPVGPPLAARALYSVPVEFTRLADLRSAVTRAALHAAGVSDADLLADDYGPCPALAQAGEALGWQAIRARSAANPSGTAVAIFSSHHPSGAQWHPELGFARPSVRIAYLTRYRAGERPAWLGL